MYKFNIYLLSILLIISQTIFVKNAIASTNLQNWQVGNAVMSGATATYTATKEYFVNGVKKIATGTAKITPTPSSIAKALAKGAGGLAISVIVDEILGAGVDWILDPKNNSINYNAPDPKLPTVPNVYQNQDSSSENYRKIYKNLSGYCASFLNYKIGSITFASYKIDGDGCMFLDKDDMTVGSVASSLVANPNYDPTAQEQQPKSIPLPEIGQKIIEQASQGNIQAQKLVRELADAQLADAQTDSKIAAPILEQFEASKSISPSNSTATTTSNDSTVNPGTKDLTTEFPAFCEYAPIVCVAANTIINFPNLLENWYSEIKDWMQDDELPDDVKTEVSIKEDEIPQIPNSNYLNWGSYCPFKTGSQTISLEQTTASIDYDLTSWCDTASQIRPFILAAGALMSFLIASGVILGRND